jgi:hypothetical protein
MAKKPYNLKLVREAGLLGMKSARKWIIFGEIVDKTLLRNYLTYTLASDAGLECTPDCRFMDVYLNGKYNGNYLMSEPIQIHRNRIDIDKNTEAIFEIEAVYRHDDHMYCINMTGDYFHIMYKEPDENNIYLDAKLANLETFKEFFEDLQASLTEGYAEYSQYIDVDSFLNWYIVNEFCKNYDSGFTSSCYCYMKNGKLYMGPVWDYHTCYGSQNVATCMDPKGYHVRESPWYSILYRDDVFNRLIHRRWTQLRDEMVFDNFLKNIDTMSNYMSESIIANYEVWPQGLKDSGLRGNKSKYTYEDEIDYLKNWVYARIDWLDGEWYGK